MSKANNWENAILALLLNATALANVADNAAASPITDLYVSFHTGDPGEAGNQSSNECAYGSYARVAVARSGSGWTITANSASPAANVDFPEATSGTETVTHFGVGKASSGAGDLYYSGTVTPNIAVATGVVPRLKSTSTITEE
jgi:hypothetical protein